MREHTDKHYEADLLHVRERVLAMGARVERMIGTAMRGLVQREESLAREVMALDAEVDLDEKEIDELCMALLAKRQPVAGDLRFITLCIKVVTDLERIGDQAVNISERTLELLAEPLLKPLIDLPRLSEMAQGMVRTALDALVAKDLEKARRVISTEDEVDKLNEQIFRELLTYILEDPKSAKRAIGLLFVSKYLERIADHATNVAEMVIFWVQGRDVRHASGLEGG